MAQVPSKVQGDLHSSKSLPRQADLNPAPSLSPCAPPHVHTTRALSRATASCESHTVLLGSVSILHAVVSQIRFCPLLCPAKLKPRLQNERDSKTTTRPYDERTRLPKDGPRVPASVLGLPLLRPLPLPLYILVHRQHCARHHYLYVLACRYYGAIVSKYIASAA